TAEIRKIYIQNRADACQERAKGMTISVSNDQKTWKEIWKADDVKPEWTIDLKNPENAKYIKFELPRSNDSFLHLNNVRIYGN
ncbi:MAG: discoidin domain-containing protein, partial [Verrucomicrobiota bacterium]